MEYLIRDGVKLYYDQTNNDDMNYLLIHGTGANHQQLKPEFDYLAKHANVISLDLRGHGESDKPHQEYTIEGFAADAIWICEQLKFEKPIIIGASMGGNISVEIAAQRPDFPSAIILLDSSLIYPKDFLATLAVYAEEINDKSTFRETIKSIVNNSCLPTDKFKNEIENMLLQTPQHVWSSCFKNMLEWDKNKVRSSIQKCSVPVLYIEAHNRIVDLETFKKLCPQLLTTKVVGSGHLISLEVPEQVNPMIKRFVDIYI